MIIKINTFEGAPKERRDNAIELGKLLDVKPTIGGTDTLTNFINICKSVGDEDLLYMEDDIQICSEFIPRIEDAINEFPNKVITFFYSGYTPTHTKEVPFHRYIYSQCVFIPNQIIKELIFKEPMFREEQYRRNDWEKIFHTLKGTYIRYFPHLVQQFNWKSTIIDGWIDQSSKYFIG